MGAANLELAHKRWGHLRGDQWRALAWMALRAWDEGKQRNGDPARQFWAGYRNLAYGLGLTSKETVEITRPQQERIRRTLRALEACNAITVLEPGCGRDTTVVALHLALADVTPIRAETPSDHGGLRPPQSVGV
jgi:hypothetical protein